MGPSFDSGRDAQAAPAEGGGSVGRAEETRRLRDALRAGPVVAVVRGESGTGVSRLVEEVLGAAEFAGWTQLRGTCPGPRGEGVAVPGGVDAAARRAAVPEIRGGGTSTRPSPSPAANITHLPSAPPGSDTRTPIAAITPPLVDDALAPIADALAGL
ncbi:ATP-binding protein, partial [Streptomyces sp. SID337]